jgi:hypothetical protein
MSLLFPLFVSISFLEYVCVCGSGVRVRLKNTPTEEVLLDAPYHRVSGCTHDVSATAVVLAVTGIQHEPLDAQHAFEVRVCADNAAEILALIDDYQTGGGVLCNCFVPASVLIHWSLC